VVLLKLFWQSVCCSHQHDQYLPILIIAMLIVFFAVHIPHLFQPPKMAQGKEWFLYVRIVLAVCFDLLGLDGE
jgi:hypothetical protein